MRPITVRDSVFEKFIRPTGQVDSYVTRLALGVGALSVEPFVDYYSNRKLDEQSRSYSAVKTCAKIIIGTSTGVAARFLGQKQGARFFEELMHKQLKKIPEVLNLQGDVKAIKDSVKEYLNGKGELSEETLGKIKTVFGQENKDKNLPGSEKVLETIRQAKTKIAEPNSDPNEVLFGVVRTIENGVPVKKELVDTVLKSLPFKKAHGEKIVRDIINDPKSVITNLSKAFGDFIGVVSAALFTIAFDIPLINLSLNYIMEKLFPNYTAKHQKASTQQKIEGGK